jgi:hypothetical protein
MKRLLCLAALLLPTASAYAMFCPGNLNQINIGDTTAQVIAQCGKPDKQASEKSSPDVPQEWGYYITADAQQQITLKVNVTIVNKKAVNITANGMSLNYTTLCNGVTIQVGDTADSIQKACGKPQFINKSEPTSTTDMSTSTTTTFQYGNTTLTFENDKLTSRS